MLVPGVALHRRVYMRLHMARRRGVIILDQAMHGMRTIAEREYDGRRKDAERIGARERRRSPQPHAPGQKPQHPARMLSLEPRIVNRSRGRSVDIAMRLKA